MIGFLFVESNEAAEGLIDRSHFKWLKGAKLIVRRSMRLSSEHGEPSHLAKSIPSIRDRRNPL